MRDAIERVEPETNDKLEGRGARRHIGIAGWLAASTVVLGLGYYGVAATKPEDGAAPFIAKAAAAPPIISKIDASSISPIQSSFEQAIEQESGYRIADHEALEGAKLKGDLSEHEVALFGPSVCPAKATRKLTTSPRSA